MTSNAPSAPLKAVVTTVTSTSVIVSVQNEPITFPKSWFPDDVKIQDTFYITITDENTHAVGQKRLAKSILNTIFGNSDETA